MNSWKKDKFSAFPIVVLKWLFLDDFPVSKLISIDRCRGEVGLWRCWRRGGGWIALWTEPTLAQSLAKVNPSRPLTSEIPQEISLHSKPRCTYFSLIISRHPTKIQKYKKFWTSRCPQPLLIVLVDCLIVGLAVWKTGDGAVAIASTCRCVRPEKLETTAWLAAEFSIFLLIDGQPCKRKR